jgi:hypothetical protein
MGWEIEMTRAVVVKGHLVGPRTVQLDEPVHQPTCEVEVILRVPAEAPTTEGLAAFLRSLPAGTRTKADIDQQLRDERDSWR